MPGISVAGGVWHGSVGVDRMREVLAQEDYPVASVESSGE